MRIRNDRTPCSAAATVLFMLSLPAQGQTPSNVFLDRRAFMSARDFQVALDQRRPQPVSDEEKQLILATLPRSGRVFAPNAAARRKLARLHQILRLHDRESVYEPVVIDVPQAFLGLHARAVLLVSETALKLLTAEELQALVAHEIGHEYVWEQYDRAKTRGDLDSLRDLETWCDVFAVLTLRRAGIPPSRLASGLQKLTTFNARRFGRALNEDAYPESAERADRLKATVEWSSASIPDQTSAYLKLQ